MTVGLVDFALEAGFLREPLVGLIEDRLVQALLFGFFGFLFLYFGFRCGGSDIEGKVLKFARGFFLFGLFSIEVTLVLP
jgi:hypothetical protein